MPLTEADKRKKNGWRTTTWLQSC